MPEHDALAQLIILLCQFVIAHADDWSGRALTIAPALSAVAAAVLAFTRSAPGLWLLQALIGVAGTAVKSIASAYKARKGNE